MSVVLFHNLRKYEIFKKFLVAISILALPFSAFAVDENFPNDKVAMWGDFNGITLDVKLIGGAPYDPLYEVMIPIWEEKTGGKVSILSKKSHFELDKEIKQDIAAGNISYCVVSNHTSFATQYGDIYRDLNGIVPKDFLAEFVPLVLDHSTVDGRLVQLPQHSDVSNLWYIKSIYEDEDNKKRFKAEYGYDLAPPETLEQWKEQAIFWSDPPNFYGTQYVGKEEAITGRFYELVIAEGGALFDENGNLLLMMKLVKELFNGLLIFTMHKQFLQVFLNYLWDETGLGFASGTVALNLDWGGWGAYFNSADSKIGGDVGLVRFPMGSGGKRGGWSGSHTYSILNGCPEENLEAAASLIWILTNHEAQMHEARGGKLPTMTRVWTDIASEMDAEGNEFMSDLFSTFSASMAEDAFTPPLNSRVDSFQI